MKNLCSFWLCITAWKERHTGTFLCFGVCMETSHRRSAPSIGFACTYVLPQTPSQLLPWKQTLKNYLFINPLVLVSAACKHVLTLHVEVQLEEPALSEREQELYCAAPWRILSLRCPRHRMWFMKWELTGRVTSRQKGELLEGPRVRWEKKDGREKWWAWMCWWQVKVKEFMYSDITDHISLLFLFISEQPENTGTLYAVLKNKTSERNYFTEESI